MVGKRVPTVGELGGASAEAAFAAMCRNLVSLSADQEVLVGDQKGAHHFIALSGCVLDVRSVWCFLTAGHVLQEIERQRRAGLSRFSRWRLHDDFGDRVESHDPIPFDYDSNPKYFIDADGLDFGLIALRPYYQRLLALNGVQSIARENWDRQHRVAFDRFMLLGLPSEFTEQDPVSVSPTFVGLSLLQQPPPGTQATAYPRLYFQLAPNCDIDIAGMSGGPILGFAAAESAYWVVALQSGWFPPARITFGCPLLVLGRLMEEAMDDAEATLRRGKTR